MQLRTKYMAFIKCLLLFICMQSCHAGDNKSAIITDSTISVQVQQNTLTDSFPAGKLITRIVCKADAGESYALYIPAKNNGAPLPVVYFFDPQGDGAGTLHRYTTLADRYGFILVASNNSKNGMEWPAEEHTWNCLWADTRARLKADSARVYVAGFSGGAKAATYIAMQQPEIDAVIAGGAILPDMLQERALHFTFTAISGEGDLNRSELVAADNSLNNTAAKHCIIFFDGIHEWPPQKIMDMAFAGLQFDAMAKKIIPVDSLFINRYIGESQQRIAVYEKANNQLRAAAECAVSIHMLAGLTNTAGWFTQKDKEIKSSAAYQGQLAVAAGIQQREQQIKAVYQQQFQQGDKNYWEQTINEVMAKAKARGAEAAMYQRLKAFLSLAFYSISNQCINNHQDIAAQHFVNLYKLVDYTNSEAWYFSAIVNARNNNAAQTKADLLKAISNGFSDKARLMQQTEFKQSDLEIDLDEITGKMK